MAKQLNVRVSDLHYEMFETVQRDFEKRGFNMNKREMLEFMINQTMMAESKRIGEEIEEKRNARN